MGTKLCNCSDNDDNINTKQNNKPKTETNLSHIEKYSNMKKNKNMSTLEEEFRTKAGTEWGNIGGLEKIIILYKINFFSIIQFSMKESDDELYNRKKITINSIINIIRLPKPNKNKNTKHVRLFNNKYRNKKVINSQDSKNNKKKDESDNTDKKNDIKIKENEENSNMIN